MFSSARKHLCQKTKDEIPSFIPGFVRPLVGNGNMFGFVAKLNNPILNQMNSVYNLAPAAKWMLSIVPMYGVVTGYPPADKIDVNTSASLALTGYIWSVYACMITPQNAGSRALATVNFCMGSVNGYNAWRGFTHQTDKKE